MLQVSTKIAEPYNSLTEMTICCTRPIGNFVRRKAGKKLIRRWIIRIALLWDREVAELAEYELAWADRSTMTSEGGERRSFEIAAWA